MITYMKVIMCGLYLLFLPTLINKYLSQDFILLYFEPNGDDRLE